GVRPGVAVATGIYWNKLIPGGANVNSTSSSALSDMGGGATFFDNLVEVRRAMAGASPVSSGLRGASAGGPYGGPRAPRARAGRTRVPTGHPTRPPSPPSRTPSQWLPDSSTPASGRRRRLLVQRGGWQDRDGLRDPQVGRAERFRRGPPFDPRAGLGE